jgi:hypothetical protein
VVDATAPDTIIDPPNPANPSNATSATFQFHGDDSAGINGFECELDGGGFTSCSSGVNYTGLSDGSHTFQVRAIDTAGNVDPTPASFTWMVDSVQPSVVVSSVTTSPTNQSPIIVTITFNEPVTGFTPSTAAGDLVIGGVGGSDSNPQVISSTVYLFELTPSGQGAVTIQVPSGSAQDDASNLNTTSNTLTIVYDTTAPSVTINQASGQPDPTSASPVNFTVVFDEPVNGLDGVDVTLGGTAGATTAVVTEIAPMDGTTYNLAISGMTASGTVTASILAGGAMDAATNTNTASTSTDDTITFNLTGPPVASGIVRAGASPTNAASVQFAVAFSKDVSGVDANDFGLANSGVTGASIAGVAGSAATYTVTVNTGSGSGTIGLNLIDDDTIVDASSIPLGGKGAGNGNLTGQVYIIDKTAPQAGNLVAANVTTAGGATHSFTIVLSDNLAIDIASLDGSDIRVTGPGGFDQPATFVSLTPATSGTPRTATYRITAAGGSWDSADNGIYTVTLQANQVRDSAGNTAAGRALGSFSVNVGAALRKLFLPMVQRAATPDLAISSISLSPSKSAFVAGEPVEVLVTVTHRGSAAAAFWIDLYINPSSPPTAANQVWNTRCALTPCFGMAWQVPSGLAPGQSITLSSRRLPPGYSIWPGYFAAGSSDLYAYADSYNPGVVAGAVAESDEANNRAELRGLTVTGPNPALVSVQDVGDLLARPVHLQRGAKR